MEEALSPRQRAPLINRLRSPTTSVFLVSNDDQLERAQARATARAATTSRFPPPPSPDHCLSKDQIIELYQNCIKLASENKINQKNTWELKLIDHLSEIIKGETAEGGSETNFQKASCTLEAGVKIYSFRVDALHSDAYKVLDGILRAGLEDKQDTVVEGDNVNSREESSHTHNKKESERKISPISTLESSFEALNVKKFDVAFAVDPLYHQTSALFDEGGAKGLLLSNLGVYEGCRVLFDSFDVPGKSKSGSLQNNTLEMIDISFAKDSIEKMVTNMLEKREICPILKVIECHYSGGENQMSSDTFDLGQKCDIRVDADDANEAGYNYNSFGNYNSCTFDHDEVSSTVHEGSDLDPTLYDHHEENDTSCEPDLTDNFEDVVNFLFQGLGFTSKQNACAGPNHWKYCNHKGSQDIPSTNVESDLTTKKPKSENLKEVDVDFTKFLEKEMPDVFVPPKNQKLLLLPANRASCNNTLPEDCRYQPESLVKLFLLPNNMCLGKRRTKCSDNGPWQQNNDFDELPSWGNESVLSTSSRNNDGCVHDDVGNLDDLVSQPRQVNRIEAHYDKTSKQVDMHALKEELWDHMQGSVEVAELVNSVALSFKHALATFPFNCQAAAPEDISPHLCFICLLHLANEHGLSIQDRPSLDDLSIHLPALASPRAHP